MGREETGAGVLAEGIVVCSDFKGVLDTLHRFTSCLGFNARP